MWAFRELRAMGDMIRQLPRTLCQRGCGSLQYVAEHNTRYPVLLVPGYAGTGTAWTPLHHSLAAAGFGHIISLSYNSFTMDPVTVSAELAHQALRALAAGGAPRIHLIGYSLGGLIVRQALARSAALSSQTGTAVMIASPHRGASLARIAPGRCARIMHPGTCSLQPAADPPRTVRWLAYYSDNDRVVPAASARLDDPRYGAANFLIPGCGHLTIYQDARLIRSLVRELIYTETSAGPLAPSSAGGGQIAAQMCFAGR